MANIRDNLWKLGRGAAEFLRGSPAGLSRAEDVSFDPFAHGGFTFRCHNSWPTDANLLTEWDAASRTMPGAIPLHSPTWQRGSFDASGATRLRLITIHQNGTLQTVLPMQLSDAGGLGTIGHWMSDYLDPLGGTADVWPALLAFLDAHWDRKVNEVVLHNIRQAAPIRNGLPAAVKGSGFALSEEIVDHAPAIELPETWEKYLESLDSHDRKETRRKLKKAEEKGGAKLVRGESQADLETALNLIEAAGGEKGDTVRKFLRPLLTAAGPTLMKEGRLDVLLLMIESKPAACLLQFPSPAGPMLYNAGHDAAMKEWSPGAVAVAMAIRSAIGRGEKVYDMMRGREPYKYRLGAVDRTLYRLTLRKPG